MYEYNGCTFLEYGIYVGGVFSETLKHVFRLKLMLMCATQYTVLHGYWSYIMPGLFTEFRH